MFYKALNFMLQNEGGYSNDLDDKGGETKWGISKRSYPDVDIANLTKEEAEMIYYIDYWNPLYARLYNKLAIRLFDLGVNMGVAKSVTILQSTLNNYFEANLKTDGVFGNQTLEAIQRTSQLNLYSMYIFEVSLYYQSLNQPKFFNGWLNRLYKSIRT